MLESQPLGSGDSDDSVAGSQSKGVTQGQLKMNRDSEASVRQLPADALPAKTAVPQQVDVGANRVALLHGYSSIGMKSQSNLSVRLHPGVVLPAKAEPSQSANETLTTDPAGNAHVYAGHTWFSSFTASPGDRILHSAIVRPPHSSWDAPSVDIVDRLEQFVLPDDSITETLELFGAGVPAHDRHSRNGCSHA